MADGDERSLLAASKPDLRVFDDPFLNAEAWPHHLDPPLTPLPAFFVRNNGRLPAPAGDPSRWILSIEGAVERPLRMTVAELSARFPVHTVEAVLECAGNGRAFFDPRTDGVPWSHGAVACARWTGVRMADVLSACGPADCAVYTGHDSPDCDRTGAFALSRGLPLSKALHPDTLLAFAMNGATLPLLHGGPLRVVAPGYPGSAWQKWLTRLRVRDCEHDGARMGGTDYRLPRNPVRPGAPVDPANFEVITAMPVKALVTMPADGFRTRAGLSLEVRGHAWGGQGGAAAVAVSADAGASWQPAELLPAAGPWSWRRFVARVRVAAAGPLTLLARAEDAAGNIQPLGQAAWNPRGYCNNAVHRVTGLATAD